MSEEQKVEIESGDKKLKLSGNNLLTTVIGMVMAGGLVLNVYILWQHKQDVTADSKETVITSRSNAVALRELNCLIMIPPGAERERMADFCRKQAALP